LYGLTYPRNPHNNTRKNGHDFSLRWKS